MKLRYIMLHAEGNNRTHHISANVWKRRVLVRAQSQITENLLTDIYSCLYRFEYAQAEREGFNSE